QEWCARIVRPTHELRGRLRAARDDDARELETEEAAGRAALTVGVERVEITELGLAEDLDAARDDTVVVTGEREPRLLDARVRDAPPEAGPPPDEAKIDGDPSVFEQLPRRHGGAPRQFRVQHAFSFARNGLPDRPRKPLRCAALFRRSDEAVGLRPVDRPEKLL